MSNPSKAAGTRPTALMTDVRPPTQSCIGKRASQPCCSAYLSRSLPTPVTATACLPKSKPAFSKCAWASSMPLRVSFVPPDFEMTMTKVDAISSPIFAKTRSNPSGSVLSKKKMSAGSFDEPRASAMNCGPSAEPPIPISKRCANFFCDSDVMTPRCTSAANFLMRAFVSSISARSCGLGASCGSRNQ